MSRYTGSTWKKSRYLGFSTLETGDELKKRAYGPGQHGQDRKRKPSEYGQQLLEKQKLRTLYGVNERQFQRLFKIAKASKGEVTGLAFFRLLESRLDNLVYRMGFARTRAAARQLVNHGHVLVNGKKCNIPSYSVKAGDVISIRESAKKQVRIAEALELAGQAGFPAWVSVDAKKMEGTFKSVPARDEIAHDINEALVVELYSR